MKCLSLLQKSIFIVIKENLQVLAAGARNVIVMHREGILKVQGGKAIDSNGIAKMSGGQR